MAIFANISGLYYNLYILSIIIDISVLLLSCNCFINWQKESVEFFITFCCLFNQFCYLFLAMMVVAKWMDRKHSIEEIWIWSFSRHHNLTSLLLRNSLKYIIIDDYHCLFYNRPTTYYLQSYFTLSYIL